MPLYAILCPGSSHGRMITKYSHTPVKTILIMTIFPLVRYIFRDELKPHINTDIHDIVCKTRNIGLAGVMPSI